MMVELNKIIPDKILKGLGLQRVSKKQEPSVDKNQQTVYDFIGQIENDVMNFLGNDPTIVLTYDKDIETYAQGFSIYLDTAKNLDTIHSQYNLNEKDCKYRKMLIIDDFESDINRDAIKRDLSEIGFPIRGAAYVNVYPHGHFHGYGYDEKMFDVINNVKFKERKKVMNFLEKAKKIIPEIGTEKVRIYTMVHKNGSDALQPFAQALVDYIKKSSKIPNMNVISTATIVKGEKISGFYKELYEDACNIFIDEPMEFGKYTPRIRELIEGGNKKLLTELFYIWRHDENNDFHFHNVGRLLESKIYETFKNKLGKKNGKIERPFTRYGLPTRYEGILNRTQLLLAYTQQNGWSRKTSTKFKKEADYASAINSADGGFWDHPKRKEFGTMWASVSQKIEKFRKKYKTGK